MGQSCSSPTTPYSRPYYVYCSFPLTRMILRNVRSFKPVSAISLREAVSVFLSEGKMDDLVLLLRLGAEVNGRLAVSAEERDPEEWAGMPGWWALSASASGHGSGPHRHYREAALHLAAKRGGARAVERLIACGAYTEVKTPNGRTPLMLASARGSIEAVLSLLKGAAVVNSTGKSFCFSVSFCMGKCGETGFLTSLDVVAL
uniref:Uncharacterized protein n=1 Tax=Chromera velia CCMP2878 TaxID=1169474 RepID=A0A0K6SAT1_9ALVE|eukprot:Cvel_10750.t2-p1 / transcript=Cvel_10750.t2 / gene=Cvel_10750 / organism=Chromera_velia_CCMP2878 / gene_product=Ankyrin repeat domain-containing protein 50, putative / transcript_product=Ankyrin repeat domain-containing protein 50, putative / location=Cvel_scaffold656:19304-19906(+) / protein_length=201 / sequence_SO=supercontig / SO=protein_coding / is_pseudo=false